MTYHKSIGEIEDKIAYLSYYYRSAELYQSAVMIWHGFFGGGSAAKPPRTVAVMCFTFVLFAGYNLLYFVEFIKSFYGSEVVDVKTDNLVAHLTEDRVIQLEEAELHTFAALCY